MSQTLSYPFYKVEGMTTPTTRQSNPTEERGQQGTAANAVPDRPSTPAHAAPPPKPKS